MSVVIPHYIFCRFITESATGDTFSLRRKDIPVKTIEFSPRHAPTGPVKNYQYVTGSPTTMPVVLMQWGDVVIVGVQPELSAVLGARIRANSPFRLTFVVTMVDGAAKYLPDITGYQRFTYEARSSPFAPGTGESVLQEITTQLKQMQALPI